jgi:hypothetical protein
MKTLAFLAVLLILASMSVPAFSQQHEMFQPTSIAFEKASDLYDSCVAQRPTCIAYIEGVADVMSASNYIDVCPPRGIRVGQIVDLVRNYYIAHRPEFSDASAWSLVYAAMREPMQCQQQPTAANTHHSNTTSL